MGPIETPVAEWSFLDVQFFDSLGIVEFLVRFAFNAVMLFIMVRWLYYPMTKRRDYMFTFMMIGTIIFLLCFLLENVKLQIGMALGLFAIFGILRYRTIQINIKEMTYLFMVIGVSVINALANKKITYTELLLANTLVLGFTWVTEMALFRKPLIMMTIVYEKIELIVPEKRKELLADLETRTGLKIKDVEIVRISFLRDTARLRIYYYAHEQLLFKNPL